MLHQASNGRLKPEFRASLNRACSEHFESVSSALCPSKLEAVGRFPGGMDKR